MPDPLFNSYIANLKLSDVKFLMLQTLWGEPSPFPKAWVKSSALLKLTDQKYFDRRLRELRDAGGLDIETKYIEGEHCWRINSTNLSTVNDRTYLTASQKSELFRKAKNRCEVCGKEDLPGVRGIQADHKIPLVRGGTTLLSNWQCLCNECNVAKRGVCKDCELACNSCAWAFPEIVGFNFIIKLPTELKKKIDSKKLNLLEIEKTLISLLEAHLDKI